jgi:predicted secreted protein
MGFVSGVVVFIMIWWTVLFMVLPWGNRPPEEDVVEGQSMSAPSLPRLKLKFMITTGIAVLLWFVIAYMIESKLISFHDMARSMSSTEIVWENTPE